MINVTTFLTNKDKVLITKEEEGLFSVSMPIVEARTEETVSIAQLETQKLKLQEEIDKIDQVIKSLEEVK